MQTMILTSQDQLKNLDNVGAVLIYPSKITTSGLIQSATSNDLVVNCIVDDDPDNAFVGKSLSALGYPTGCYIVINYQSKKDVKDITGAFSNNLQLGYRAAIIVNKSDYTQDDFKAFSQYGIIVIDHNDVKNHILTVPEFLTSRSLAMIRDYTNVDISNVGPGAFVGVGKDTSGLGGGRSFGYSTNGQDFYAVITPKGLVFRQIDALRMWRLLKPQQAAQIGDFFNNKVAKEIEAQNESLKSAVATANSAVNAANQAVNDSKVNSDAINAMKSAESKARADADKALSDAQAAIKNVSSNVDAVWKNIASVEGQVNSVQTANEAVAKQLKADLSSAKEKILTANDNLTKAQAAIEDNKKAIAANVSSINATIAQHKKDIEAAQAANAQTANELASYTKQAEAQEKTIKALQSDDDSTKLTIADIKGNVTQVQDSVTGLTASLKDTNNNVATVKAQADSLSSTLTTQGKSVSQLLQTVTSLTSSLKDADGRLSTVEQTAKSQTTTISGLKDNFTQVKQEADKLTDTLKDTQGNIAQVQATAKGLSEQIESAQGDISNLTKTATSIQASLTDHSKRIASVEARADKLESDMKDAQGNITTAMQTASEASVIASDAKSNAATAVVTANGVKAVAQDANSTATEAKVTASEASVIASNAKSDVLTVATTASDAKMLATNANSQAMEANATASNVSINLSEIEKTANNAASQASVATSKADSNAKQISNVADTVTTLQTSIQATQKELSGKVDQATIDSTNKRLEDINAQVSVVAGEVRSKAEQTTVSGISTDLNDLKAKAESIEKDDIDFNDCKSQMNIFSKGPKNAPNDNYWWYLRVEPGTEGRVTQYAVSDRDNHHYTRQFILTSWTPWKETADSNDVANLQAQVDKHSTEISNNTKEIQLKADSQTVNEINQTVQQQQAQQKVLADQITSKVSSADVEKLVDGKGFATKDLVESSITQASGKINETITNLQGNLQNITADLTGLQSTVKDKADQSQITQLTNIVQSKVSSKDYQTTISQLTNDINAKVAKGDLISQINIEAGQTLIQSKKLFLDADSVVFSGKAFIPDAAIANLSLDKLTTGHITIPLTDKFGNEIELGREGIEISSLYSSIDRKEPDSSANSNDSSANSSQTDNNAVQAASLMTSFAAIANQPDDSGGLSSNGNIPDQPDNPDHPDTYTTSASYRMRLTADGLRMIQRVHYKNDRDGKENDRDFTELQVSPVNAVGAETTDGANGLAFVTGVDDNDYTTGNQPASFLALGSGKKTNEKGTTFHNLDVIYSATSRSGYPAGMNVNTHLHILPPGADHSIQAVWVSWSNWDGGEKYPALVQDGANWGGVAFPKSGRVTLFDANGRYYTPDRNTGIGPYNSYGG